MRILFCNFEYPPLGGGGGVINAFLAEELAKRHEVSVLTSRAVGLASREERSGVEIIRVPVFFRRSLAAANFPSMLAYLPMGIKYGRQYLRRVKVDVVNTHFALPTGPVGQSLAQRFGVPNVLSVHGGDLYDPSKRSSPHRHAVLRKWVSRLVHEADSVVAQSENTRENLLSYFAPGLPTSIIPLGIPRPPTVPGDRAEFGFHQDDILVVTIGRLVRRKRLDQLIEVVARLPENIRLVIVGVGPEERRLRSLARSLDISKRVIFAGRVSEAEKFKLLSVSDVFASTSQHEGFGLVFLEAMALGLPVVCYGHGGQIDYLEDGRSGFLLELNDVAAFTDRCRKICSDRSLRIAMGEWNKRCVEEFFIDNCARRYESLFESVIARRLQST